VVRATWVAPTTVGGSRPRRSVAHVTTTSRAHAYISLSLFLYPFYTLSLSLYKEEGSS